MGTPSQVVLVKDADMQRRTRQALHLAGGLDRVVHRGDKVFIKPNLVDGAPFETGEIVQLGVMEVLIDEAFRAGAADVIIGETPTWRRKTPSIEAYERLAERLHATFLDLSQYPFVEIEVPDPVLFPRVRLSKILDDCDVFLNVPTLKTHVQAGVTLAIKNLFGLVPGRPGTEDKGLYHRLDRIEELIVDLNQARRADFILVDGSYTTFHIGPRPLDDFTETFPLHLTLAGVDPVAIDAVGATILGIDPLTLRYLQWAEEKGLGTRNLAAIDIVGTPLTEAFERRAVDVVAFANARMRNVQILNYGACTGCLKYAPQIQRFRETTLGSKALFIMGPHATAAQLPPATEDAPSIVLCGSCAAPTFYNGLRGVFIPGCPPAIEDLQKTLRKMATAARQPHP